MLNKDYKEMLQHFLKEKVDFIVVGAYALAAHGYPRATGDIDLFVKPDKNNSKNVYQALKKFGAPLHQIKSSDFEQEDIIFQIGVIPRRIDIITSISGVSFEDAKSDISYAEVEGLKLPILSIEKLIKNKTATGRDKDLLDVKLLKQMMNQEM